MATAPRQPQDRKPKATKAETPGVVRLRVQGRDYTIPDPETLTIDEMIEIEDCTGQQLEEMSKGRQFKALLYIAMKRSVPSVEWAAVGTIQGGMISSPDLEGQDDDAAPGPTPAAG